MDFNKKPKRKAQSIQDMVGPGMRYEQTPQRRPIQKSGYQGPYKKPVDDFNTIERPGATQNVMGKTRMPIQNTGKQPYVPPASTGALGQYGWMIFGGILLVCVVVSIILGMGKGTIGSTNYVFPTDVLTITGLVTDITEERAEGNSALNTNSTTTGDTQMNGADSENVEDGSSQMPSTVGESLQSGVPVGMNLNLDDGTLLNGTYPQAASYAELLTQIESALAAGDSSFIGAKIGYRDDTTDAVLGYPQSVVEHFVSYMAADGDKRTLFLSSIQQEDEFSYMNGTAYIVALPQITFTVNMGYDNTTFSISGFSDQVINAGQVATITPLLPCMYTISISNPNWPNPTTQEVEADFNEGNLTFNIGTSE